MRHPDEGEIHAWLDGALDPATAAGLEAHVAACPACAAAVAEARGLIAGASRILMALDAVPSGVIPAGSQAGSGVGSDELATRRIQQRSAIIATAKQRLPWYARRPVQVAAGLMLVVGVGGVVARTAERSADQVSIQFETDAAPVSRGPAVDIGQATANQPAVAELRGVPAAIPAVTPPPPSPGRAANQSPARADAGTARTATKTSAPAGAVADAFGVYGQRAAGAPERVPPPSAVAAAPATVPLSAGMAVATPPIPLMDTAVAGAVGRLDNRLRRMESAAFAPASGVIAGKVVSNDTPVAGAVVGVAVAGISVQTAADGSFRLPPLPPGRYTLEARRIGYQPAKLEGVQLASGDTAYASFAMTASSLSLSEVVVTASRASMPAIGGACFALDVDAVGDIAGMPLLPRRIGFRMEESPMRSQFADAESRSARPATVPAAASQRRLAGSASEPASPLAWQVVAGDSIEVIWPTETDVITLRLEVRETSLRGTIARGTARSSQGNPPRTATVSGRKVACGGGR